MCLGGGDINGDTWPDVVFGMEGVGVATALGNSEGGFGPALSVETHPPSACVISPSKPGSPVFIFGRLPQFGSWHASPSEVTEISTISFQDSGAAGHFTLADYNGDGIDDIITGTSPFGATDRIRAVVANASYSELTPVVGPTAGDEIVSLATGDINADSRADIAWVDSRAGFPDRISIALGTSAKTLPTTVSIYEAPPTSVLTSVAIADVAGDEQLDLAFIQNGAVYVAIGDGTLGFPEPYELATTGNASFLVAAELDGQEPTELAIARENNATLLLVRNGSPEPIIDSLPLDSIPGRVTPTDINMDGSDDILVAADGDGPISVVLSDI